MESIFRVGKHIALAGVLLVGLGAGGVFLVQSGALKLFTLLPGKQLTVSIGSPGMSREALLDCVEQFATEAGYVNPGPDGFDALHGTRTSVLYRNPENVMIDVDLGESGSVLITVTSDSDRFSGSGIAAFDGLRARIEERWPGSTTFVGDLP